MQKRQITIDEIRAIQLEILDDIHNFCIEHNISYSLGGGTLLGAVRHKGYIPWDDDIDIMLPRQDYERFIRDYPGSHPHHQLQTYKNDKSYWLCFAKIYDSRTVLEEVNIKTGIYVDVFPIDGLPNSSDLKEYTKRYSYLSWLIFCTTRRYQMSSSELLKCYIRKAYYLSRNRCIRRLENLLFSNPFDTSEYAGAIVGRYLEKECMPSDVFKSYIKLPFEGRMYYAIKDYDAYLTKHYGDYMQLPPLDKRTSNHDFNAWWK